MHKMAYSISGNKKCRARINQTMDLLVQGGCRYLFFSASAVAVSSARFRCRWAKITATNVIIVGSAAVQHHLPAEVGQCPWQRSAAPGAPTLQRRQLSTARSRSGFLTAISLTGRGHPRRARKAGVGRLFVTDGGTRQQQARVEGRQHYAPPAPHAIM
jgi:hypothetical protein